MLDHLLRYLQHLIVINYLLNFIQLHLHVILFIEILQIMMVLYILPIYIINFIFIYFFFFNFFSIVTTITILPTYNANLFDEFNYIYKSSSYANTNVPNFEQLSSIKNDYSY